MKEEWRSVLRNQNYEVSNLGRVRRVTRGGGAVPGRVLKAGLLRNGYMIVSLWKDGEGKSTHVSALVSEAFLGPKPEGLDINHKDGVKKNNTPGNLEYVTRSENIQHAFDTGLNRNIGEGHARSKLTEAQVRDVLERLSTGETCASIGRSLDVGRTVISDIKIGRTWGHLSSS